ncbi:MAG: hypothetical protein JRI59_05160 [Deltaproteobacteria bacterium]|nr:hypothetical protein [Deltaproteobacteria bacterium]
MPLYRYQCIACEARDLRIGGVDDHVAVCARCGHLMLRLDLDLFAPYFDKVSPEAEQRDLKHKAPTGP